jgi:DNA-binding response OmpR family regulator
MKPKVLIVHNDRIVLAFLARFFRNAGFETHHAFEGVEGLRLAMQERPDALVFEYHLPTMDGVTMLERIRQTPWASDMVAVLHSRSLPRATLDRASALDARIWSTLHAFSELVRVVATAIVARAGKR